VPPERVTFNSGATFGLNLCIAALSKIRPQQIITSTYEHNSVARAAERYFGDNWRTVPPASNSLLDPELPHDALQTKASSLVITCAESLPEYVLQCAGR